MIEKTGSIKDVLEENHDGEIDAMDRMPDNLDTSQRKSGMDSIAFTADNAVG